MSISSYCGSPYLLEDPEIEHHLRLHVHVTFSFYAKYSDSITEMQAGVFTIPKFFNKYYVMSEYIYTTNAINLQIKFE